MFESMRKTPEEKKIEKLKKRKISANELYVVEVGVSNGIGYGFSEFLGDKFALVRYYKKEYDNDSYYQDIFTGSKYHLFATYHVRHGQQCCNCPVSIINILGECDLKYRLLGDGYITMYDALKIMKLLNNVSNSKERTINNLRESQPKTKKLTKDNSTIVPFKK